MTDDEKRRFNAAYVWLSAQVLALRTMLTLQIAGAPVAGEAEEVIDRVVPADAFMSEEVRTAALEAISQIQGDAERLRSSAFGKPN